MTWQPPTSPVATPAPPRCHCPAASTQRCLPLRAKVADRHLLTATAALGCHQAYHGLVRAVVRVTSVAGRTAPERSLLARIDVHGPLAAQPPSGVKESVDGAPAEPIVVEASAPGLQPARVTIATSVDAASHGVLAAASAAAGKPVDFFGGH